MSEEQLKALLEKVKDDTELQEKFNGAADTDAVLAIAKEDGFSISTADLEKAQSKLWLSISTADLECGTNLLKTPGVDPKRYKSNQILEFLAMILERGW